MDKIAERATYLFGSALFLVLHLAWWTTWFVIGGDLEVLITIVSLEAIVLSLLILRGQNVQSKRMEDAVRKDLASSKSILKEVRGR